MADSPIQKTLTVTYRAVRRVTVAIVGASVVIVGVVMIVLPGPALLVIPAGLGILGLEFAFARRWLRHLKETGEGAILKWRRVLTSDNSTDVDPKAGAEADLDAGADGDASAKLDADPDDPFDDPEAPDEGAQGTESPRGSARSDPR